MVIVDGHNRFRICEKHSLPFKMLWETRGCPSTSDEKS